MSLAIAIVDSAQIDCRHVAANWDEVRRYIPQRGAMQQITAIVLDDPDQGICVGYKDIADDEFWARGRDPVTCQMPGVLICEAAAQVFSYFVQRHDLSGVQLLGFGGLDKVKFRGVVRPGDRLVIACRLTKLRRGRMMQCDFESYVGPRRVCWGKLVGVPLPINSADLYSFRAPADSIRGAMSSAGGVE